MIYEEKIQMDENNRLIECPVCHNTQFSKDARHCRICGLELWNHCIPEYGSDEWHINPANARFCETCGARTVFFEKELLLPWDKVAKENKTEAAPFFVDEEELPF